MNKIMELSRVVCQAYHKWHGEGEDFTGSEYADLEQARAALQAEVTRMEQELEAVLKDRVALASENDKLRAALANGSGPCAYCSLPKDQWAKCASGFPGCARGDDAMLCPHVGASLEAEEKLAALEAEVARLTKQVDALKPQPYPGGVFISACWLDSAGQLYACRTSISKPAIEQSVDPTLVIEHAVACIAGYVQSNFKFEGKK